MTRFQYYDIVVSDMEITTLRLTLTLFFALGCSAAAGRQAEKAPRRASATIELRLNASADAAFPLFGPVREAEWAPDWSPKWFYPPEPRQSSEGAVFTTSHYHGSQTWVMTTYDPEKRAVEYVQFIPDQRVTEIIIIVRPTGPATCTARVSYRVTALSGEGAEFVAHFAKEFPNEAPHWEKAVNAVLLRASPPADSPHNVITVKPN